MKKYQLPFHPLPERLSKRNLSKLEKQFFIIKSKMSRKMANKQKIKHTSEGAGEPSLVAVDAVLATSTTSLGTLVTNKFSRIIPSFE